MIILWIIGVIVFVFVVVILYCIVMDWYDGTLRGQYKLKAPKIIRALLYDILRVCKNVSNAEVRSAAIEACLETDQYFKGVKGKQTRASTAESYTDRLRTLHDVVAEYAVFENGGLQPDESKLVRDKALEGIEAIRRSIHDDTGYKIDSFIAKVDGLTSVYPPELPESDETKESRHKTDS